MIQSISEAELEIMKIVWANNEATLFSHIMNELQLKEKVWQKNTVITLLSRLMDKGVLKAKKSGRRNEYAALISESEYQMLQTKNFLDKIYEGNAQGLVSNLIQNDLLTMDEYEELKDLLERGGKVERK